MMSAFLKTAIRRNLVASLLSASFLALPGAAMAQNENFAPGWILNQDVSALRFQSVKNSTKVESSTFATYTGTIDETGLATIKVLLDSVDTKVDLRNVRMRFLLFETFQHPEATITMQIDPAMIADLQEVRRKIVVAPYSITLHGITSQREAEIAVTLLDDNKVSVTSATPISLPIADFGLEGGVQKLQEAANVVIIPSATVTFDFTFDRSTSPESFQVAATEMDAAAGLTSAAIETAGDFAMQECKGRFDIVSHANEIHFETSSALLAEASLQFLDSIRDIVERCPDLTIQVAGHTDSDGGARLNQVLSEARANTVRNYLVEGGVEGARIQAIGFGEDKPIVENDTPENKFKNRRIEFGIVEPSA